MRGRIRFEYDKANTKSRIRKSVYEVGVFAGGVPKRYVINFAFFLGRCVFDFDVFAALVLRRGRINSERSVYVVGEYALAVYGWGVYSVYGQRVYEQIVYDEAVYEVA